MENVLVALLFVLLGATQINAGKYKICKSMCIRQQPAGFVFFHSNLMRYDSNQSQNDDYGLKIYSEIIFPHWQTQL